MLHLPQITLIALTSKNIPDHEEAIRKSTREVKFGAVKLIVDYSITDINEWNRKIVFELHHYVQTSHCLLIHADGYVIHPEVWEDKWLEYDYIGAPWPIPRGDEISYRVPETGELIRVGNSVSLRSRRILTAPTTLNLEWRPYYGYTNEDGFLCVNNRTKLEEYGIRYAPVSEAAKFSREHEVPENQEITKTFCFHQVD